MGHSLFICSPTEGHLGCFQVLAAMNKAIRNVCVQDFVWRPQQFCRGQRGPFHHTQFCYSPAYTSRHISVHVFLSLLSVVPGLSSLCLFQFRELQFKIWNRILFSSNSWLGTSRRDFLVNCTACLGIKGKADQQVRKWAGSSFAIRSSSSDTAALLSWHLLIHRMGIRSVLLGLYATEMRNWWMGIQWQMLTACDTNFPPLPPKKPHTHTHTPKKEKD